MEDMGKVQVGGVCMYWPSVIHITPTYLWGCVANAEYNKQLARKWKISSHAGPDRHIHLHAMWPNYDFVDQQHIIKEIVWFSETCKPPIQAHAFLSDGAYTSAAAACERLQWLADKRVPLPIPHISSLDRHQPLKGSRYAKYKSMRLPFRRWQIKTVSPPLKPSPVPTYPLKPSH